MTPNILLFYYAPQIVYLAEYLWNKLVASICLNTAKDRRWSKIALDRFSCSALSCYRRLSPDLTSMARVWYNIGSIYTVSCNKEQMIGRESKKHKNLKALARQFLIHLGCNNIIEEYPVIGLRPAKGSRCVDVMGFVDTKGIAVECGANTEKHLKDVNSKVSELYVLPYGATEPYRYEKGMNVCPYCGHKV